MVRDFEAWTEGAYRVWVHSRNWPIPWKICVWAQLRSTVWKHCLCAPQCKTLPANPAAANWLIKITSALWRKRLCTLHTVSGCFLSFPVLWCKVTISDVYYYYYYYYYYELYVQYMFYINCTLSCEVPVIFPSLEHLLNWSWTCQSKKKSLAFCHLSVS